MRAAATLAVFLLTPFAALADKYGVNEALSEGGPLPTWALPIAFVALLVYHLHSSSKIASQSSQAKFEAENLRRMLASTQAETASEKQRADNLQKQYQDLQASVQKYFEGIISDDEFEAAILPHLEPVEYTTYKPTEA